MLELGPANQDCMPSKKESTVFYVDRGELPHSGDIVLLEPSGVGTVLFEIGSNDNAILLTEKCNSRCIMCPQPPQHSEFEEDCLSDALQVIGLMDPTTKILGITGGEPTLFWESFEKVVSACIERAPAIYLQLLTNGRILRSYEKAEKLATVCGQNLYVGVPLYGDFDSLHDRHSGVKGAFWETVEGLFNLQQVGIPTELRIVMTRLNYDRLPEWAEFVYRTFPFLSRIAFMELEPVGYASRNLKTLWIEPEEYVPFLEKAVRILHRRDMEVSIFNCQLCNLPESLWRFSCKSISGWKTSYLPECTKCGMNFKCGGFFASSKVLKAGNISPFHSS